MSSKKIVTYKTLDKLVTRLLDDLRANDFILLYAFNGTGKTRTSMAFKEKGKKKVKTVLKDANGSELVDKNGKTRTETTIVGDTLYFNAFTEDLFIWDNDFQNDTDPKRVLKMNADSKFFNGFKSLALDEKIFAYLERYTTFDFGIDYDKLEIFFKKQIKNPKYNAKNPNNIETEYIVKDNIKISRGEENIFIWCVFLAICELAIDESESYDWVKYIYIDDPISSLDDNNAIAVASDLAKLLKSAVTKQIEDSGEKRTIAKDDDEKIKIVVSSHHSLFFNVMCNELKRFNHNRYFLHKNGTESHSLQKTDDTPFFHHVAMLSELKQATITGDINTYHFNSLRSILEKTATFFGLDDFGKCIYGFDKDDDLYIRALNLLSHGKYSVYEPVEMNDDNKNLFIRILDAYLDKFDFELPQLLKK